MVFDLGGVLIDLKRENAVSALEGLGIPDVDSLLGLYRQEGPFLALETGEITAAEFFDQLRPLCRPGTTDQEITDAFNCFLVGLPEERLDALMELRRRGKHVYALSNTNAVMYNSWIAKAFSVQGKRINDYFEGVMASFEQGVCKPHRGIFEALIERYQLDPTRTLYLDDSAANCEAAAGCGLRTATVGAPGSGSDMMSIVARID